MGEIVDGIKAFNEPACKLIDAISKGIGALYEPHRIKKKADAEAYRIAKISSALIENSDVSPVYKNGEIAMSAEDYKELQKRAGTRLVHQEINRQINIESIADKAYDLLPSNPKNTSEQVNDDWITHFITSAQDVSDDEIQNIWAKILSDEIVMPSTHSYRLLDALRNMTKSEIMLFNRIAPYVISESFIPNDDIYNKNNDIKYEDILILEECGLINSSAEIIDSFTVDADDERIIFNDTYVMVANKPEKDIKFDIPTFCLSRAGIELYGIIKLPNNNDAFISYAKSIKVENQDMKFFLYKITYREGERIWHDNNNCFDE